jgi:predicted metalloprotease
VSVAGIPAYAGSDNPSGGGSEDPTLDDEDIGAPEPAKGYEKTIQLAIDDIQDFWSDEFPDVYGDDYEPIPDDRIFAAEPGTKLPKCQGQVLTYDDAENNAFYCYEDNYIAYDDEELFPRLYNEFGDFAIALVLAHEWGHAIQDRAENDDAPDIQQELQADCFAGAWVSNLKAGRGRLGLANGNLDQGLAALVQFKDPVGTDLNQQGAHGNGFDRAAAFQEGFQADASECATYFDAPPPALGDGLVTELACPGGICDEADENVPAEDVIPISVDILNDFYTQNAAGYVPFSIDDIYSFDSSSDDVDCGGRPLDTDEIENRVFYCLDENDPYIGFEEDYVQHVYDDIGDFGVTTLFGVPFATYTQQQQGFDTTTDEAAIQQYCYTGGFARALYDGQLSSQQFDLNPDGTGNVQISPGDLDETVSTIIDYAKNRGVDPTLDATFQLIAAFRQGFFGGASTC